MTKAQMTHNTFYNFTRLIDRFEEAQERALQYLPEPVRDHAAELVKAQAEFTRAGYATAARVMSIVRTAAEETEEQLRSKFEEAKTVAEETVAKVRKTVSLV